MEKAFITQKYSELTCLRRQLNACQDLPSLLQTSVKLARNLSEVEACFIWSVNSTPSQLRAYYPSPGKGKLPQLTDKASLIRFLHSAQPRFKSSLQTNRSCLIAGLGGARLALFPLVIDDKPWGLLAFSGGKSASFVETERILLQHIAQEIETALRLTSLAHREMRLQEQVSEVMSAFAESLALARNPEDFLRLVCETFLRLAQADSCSVWKIREARPLRLASCARASGAFKPRALIASPLVEKVSQEGIAGGWKIAGGEASGSALAIPIKGHSKITGVIALFWKASEAYSEAEKNFLLSFARYLELSLEHILLQQADKRTQALLTELGEAGGKISDPPDGAGIIKTALPALAGILHCPIVGLASILPDGNLEIAEGHILGTRAAAFRQAYLVPSSSSLVASARSKSGPFATAETSGDPFVGLLGAKSLACVPLPGAEMTGLLFAARRNAVDFSKGELALLSVYASQIALALRNVELVDNQTRNLDQLATISEIVRGLSLSSELLPMLLAALGSACRLLAMPGGLILLEKSQEAGLTTAAVYGLDQPPADRKALLRLEEQGNLSALAFRQHKIIVSGDLSRDGRFNYRLLARKGGPLSAIAAPLSSSGRYLGAICAYSWEPRFFSENDRRVFSIVADTLGVAIDNSLHKADAQHRTAAYSELFREVNRQVRNSLQTIVALLEMTSAEPELSSGEALQRSLQRIQCIHLIHSLLSAKTPNKMEIRESTRQIAEMAQAAFGRSAEEINISVSGARVFLSPQKATALSLAINELVYNALNHGLRQRPCGKIHINFSQTGSDLLVELSDNGCGLPESFNLEKDARIGLKIVSAFVQQRLAGSFHLFRRASGTVAQMRFPCQFPSD